MDCAPSTSTGTPGSDFDLPLPNELIIKILKYADHSVVIRLGVSSDQCFRSFTFVSELLRNLNLCKKTYISLSELRKFLASGIRRKEIENLCVRGYESLGCVPFNSNSSWVRLKKLDISYCGINVIGLLSIINHLPELEELSWSTFFESGNEPEIYHPSAVKRQKVETILTDFKMNKLQRVNLDIRCANLRNVLILIVLFKDISVLRLRVCHVLDRHPNFSCLSALDNVNQNYMGPESSTFKNLKEFTLISDNHQRWGRNYPTITHVRCVASVLHSFVKKRVEASVKLQTNISVIQKDMQLNLDLDWITAPNSLPLINIQTKPMDEEIIQWIQVHGGTCLKFLSLSTCHSDWKKIKALPEIVENCPNIEELNLDGYFDIDKNHDHLSCFSKLSKLKALCLSDVLIKRGKSSSSQNTHFENYFKGLKRVSHLTWMPDDIFKLDKVAKELQSSLEELEIRALINSSRVAKLSDADLLPVSKFHQLKSLTLTHLHGCFRGTFFNDIFTNCRDLIVLRIHNLEYNNLGVCSYQEALFRDLHKLTKLEILSIHHNQLEWTKSYLWKSITGMEKLKQLCIGSNKLETLNVVKTVRAHDNIYTFLNAANNLETLHIHAKIKNSKQVENLIKRHRSFSNKPSAEIVVHDLTFNENLLKPTEWSSFSSSLENKKFLCWGMSNIAYGTKLEC